jgi:hypothetical protein
MGSVDSMDTTKESTTVSPRWSNRWIGYVGVPPNATHGYDGNECKFVTRLSLYNVSLDIGIKKKATPFASYQRCSGEGPQQDPG